MLLAGAATANVDNDSKDTEVLTPDKSLPPQSSYGLDTDGDGDHDVVVVGTEGGASVTGTGNVDNDPNDTEVLVQDPNLPPNGSYGIDLDGDGDHDIIVVGTQNRVKVAGSANVDNDPKDSEVLVHDPNLTPNSSYGVDVDHDGDTDIVVLGTKGGAKTTGSENVDNDPQDSEVLMQDPKLPVNSSFGVDVDGDGDQDVIVVGTKGGTKVIGADNFDQDASEKEVLVQNAKLGFKDSYGRDLDGDGDYDIVVVGTKDRAAPRAPLMAAPPVASGNQAAPQQAAPLGLIAPQFSNVPAAESLRRDLALLCVRSKASQISGLNPIDPTVVSGERPANTTVTAGNSQIVPVSALAPGQTVGTSALESCIGVIVNDGKTIYVTHIKPEEDAGKTLANLLSTLGANAHAVIAGGNGDPGSNLTLKEARAYLEGRGITIEGFANYEGIHVVKNPDGSLSYVVYQNAGAEGTAKNDNKKK